MAVYHSMKITVIRKLSDREVHGRDLPDLVPELTRTCDQFEVGQEFIVSAENFQKPPDFCTWAWTDIYKMLLTLSSGGDFTWMTSKGAVYACCTDGARPVFFKLERIENSQGSAPVSDHAK